MRKEDVSFIRKGEGKDLVFLHGYLSSKEAFLPFLDYFSGRYRVTAFDFCGFGQSVFGERLRGVDGRGVSFAWH